MCVRLSARHKTLRPAPRGVAGRSVAGVTTGADILIINTGPAIPTPVCFNLIGAWLRLHLRDIAPSFPSLRAETSFPAQFLVCKKILYAIYVSIVTRIFLSFRIFLFENSVAGTKNLTDEQ